MGGRAGAEGAPTRRFSGSGNGARDVRPLFDERAGARRGATSWFSRGDYDATVRGSRPLAATYYVAPSQHLGLEPLTATARFTGDRLRSVGADPGARRGARTAPSSAAGASRGSPCIRCRSASRRAGAGGRRNPARGRAGPRDAGARSSSACRNRPARTTISRRAGGDRADDRAARRRRDHRRLENARRDRRRLRRSRCRARRRRPSASSIRPASTARSRLMRSRMSRSKALPCRSPSEPATCAARRSARSPSSPKASSTNWRMPRASSRSASGWRCSAATRASRAASRRRRRRGGWDGGGRGSTHGHRRGFGLRLAHRAARRRDHRRRPAVEVHRLVAAVDCGRVVNPRLVTPADRGRADLGARPGAGPRARMGRPECRARDPSARSACRGSRDTPDIHVQLDPQQRARRAESAASASTVLAPAVANAIYAATGKRLRNLPFDPMRAHERPPHPIRRASATNRRAADQPRHARRARSRARCAAISPNS